MAHRTILTERQRSALFDLPTDDASMMRHYILADDDYHSFGSSLRLPAGTALARTNRVITMSFQK